MVLTLCGHSICRFCLDRIINESDNNRPDYRNYNFSGPKCPQCRTIIKTESNGGFVTNWSLLEVNRDRSGGRSGLDNRDVRMEHINDNRFEERVEGAGEGPGDGVGGEGAGEGDGGEGPGEGAREGGVIFPQGVRDNKNITHRRRVVQTNNINNIVEWWNDRYPLLMLLSKYKTQLESAISNHWILENNYQQNNSSVERTDLEKTILSTMCQEIREHCSPQQIIEIYNSYRNGWENLLLPWWFKQNLYRFIIQLRSYYQHLPEQYYYSLPMAI